MSLCCAGCKEKNEDSSIKEEAYYAVNIQNTKPYKEINDGEKIIERVSNLKTKNIESIKVDLGANIESSPAIFNDKVVVATRGGLIYSVKIK